MNETTVVVYNGRSESKAVENVDELEAALRQAHKQWPAVVYIDVASHRDMLCIDVDEHIGCILFGNRSGDPPYCMIVGDSEAPDGDFEFSVGGTATPISLRRCIPIEEVISLARHFYEHGEFPEGTEWEED